ncbi:hypothetical protein RJT34_23367 [Clitoria ternatea]|uniref:Uncharacterized protein n=1 Tax=Clitoria ternatea TaxID=43366 RepID=A0AAN9FKZ4_CLITE
MRAPTILRTLPLRQLQPRAPVAVTPLPEKTRFDRKLTAELDTLRSQGGGGEIGLAHLLDAAITTQKIALDSLVNVCYIDDVDRVFVDKYLEDNVEILDACNYFMDKMGNINEYVDSLRVVVHLVDSCSNNNKGSAKDLALTRALQFLDSCQGIEKRCKEMEKGGFCLKKTFQQKLFHHETESPVGEAMCGSKAMALMCCRLLQLGLSFDSKRGLPKIKLLMSQPRRSCCCSWMGILQELAKQAEGSAEKKRLQRKRSCWSSLLQQTVSAATELKEQMKGKREKEMKYAVERVKISCRELEHGVEIVEERVKSLYKSLIDVRMTLLGILSKPTLF